MAIYRKDEQGRLIRTAGNLVQRWNDRIFLTEHSVVGDRDYYDIETAANKFITGLTDYTEFQLYIAEPNETSNVYVRFAGKELKLTRSDENDIVIGYLFRRMTFYTLDTNSGIIWMDVLLQPAPFTNDTFGSIKGENIDGKVYAEADGTGSIVGWSELKTSVSNIQQELGNIGEVLDELNGEVI